MPYSKNRPLTDAEIKHNQSLWKHYPLGYVNSIYDLLQSVHTYLTDAEKEKLHRVYEALDDLDVAIRNNRYPVKKKR